MRKQLVVVCIFFQLFCCGCEPKDNVRVQDSTAINNFKIYGENHHQEIVTSSHLVGKKNTYQKMQAIPRLNRKLKTKKIKVAIIDSGIDPSHPAFKGVTIKGYDFLLKRNTLIDPYGHGTHVTGIVVSIAPNASIYAYRVLNEAGDGINQHIVKALHKAIKEKVDVINLSFGNHCPNQSIITEIEHALRKGIVLVVAAGNDGPSYSSVGFPASHPDVITVGFSETQVPIMQVGNKNLEIFPFEESPPFPEGKYEIIDCKNGKKHHFHNVEGKVALVKRSKKSLFQISVLARRYGAISLVVYDSNKEACDGDSPIRFLDEEYEIPTGTIAGKLGKYVKKKLRESQCSVRFRVIEKERVSRDSSCGPVKKSGDIKPDVIAPGTDILSCVPIRLNPDGYEKNSGTSVAAPYVTGAVTLLKEAHPHWSPNEIKAALCNTATTLTDSFNKPISCLKQGSGSISIQKAKETSSLISPVSLSFGCIPINKEAKSITRKIFIKNLRNFSSTYDIRTTLQSGKGGITLTAGPSVMVSGNSIASVLVRLKIDAKKVSKGIITGMILLTDGESEQHVPVVVALKE